MARDAARTRALEPAAILDLLATAILVVDARSNVLAWLNQAAADLLATSPGAARGRPLASLVADGAAIEALLARSRASEEPLALRGFALSPAARADARYQVDVSLTPLAGALPRRRAGRDRGHDAALAHDARQRAARAAGRQPRDGAPARARDQESARRPARRGATARARAAERRSCANTRA